jgi:hypothetical protein
MDADGEGSGHLTVKEHDCANRRAFWEKNFGKCVFAGVFGRKIFWIDVSPVAQTYARGPDLLMRSDGGRGGPLAARSAL